MKWCRTFGGVAGGVDGEDGCGWVERVEGIACAGLKVSRRLRWSLE
jgi:hypothetical protein